MHAPAALQKSFRLFDFSTIKIKISETFLFDEFLK